MHIVSLIIYFTKTVVAKLMVSNHQILGLLVGNSVGFFCFCFQVFRPFVPELFKKFSQQREFLNEQLNLTHFIFFGNLNEISRYQLESYSYQRFIKLIGLFFNNESQTRYLDIQFLCCMIEQEIISRNRILETSCSKQQCQETVDYNPNCATLASVNSFYKYSTKLRYCFGLGCSLLV